MMIHARVLAGGFALVALIAAGPLPPAFAASAAAPVLLAQASTTAPAARPKARQAQSRRNPTASSQPARNQPPKEPELSTRLKFRTDVQEAAPFVQQSRPAQQDYLPVGVTPQRTGVQRSAAELQAIEKELDAQRQRSRAFANRPKPPSSYDGRVPPRLRPATPAQAE